SRHREVPRELQLPASHRRRLCHARRLIRAPSYRQHPPALDGIDRAGPYLNSSNLNLRKMAAILSRVRHDTYPKTDSAITEPRLVRWLLILVAILFLALFLFMPLVAVFVEA